MDLGKRQEQPFNWECDVVKNFSIFFRNLFVVAPLLGVLDMSTNFIVLTAPVQAQQSQNAEDKQAIVNSRDLETKATPAQTQRKVANRQNNQIRQRDQSIYMNAYNMGKDAINGCHNESRLEDCEKFSRIQNKLSEWCSQGDTMACFTWSNLSSSDSHTRSLKVIRSR